MTALVLSGGGMFAAWEAGFWKVLSERFQPDLIAGASAGAWNGWGDRRRRSSRRSHRRMDRPAHRPPHAVGAALQRLPPSGRAPRQGPRDFRALSPALSFRPHPDPASNLKQVLVRDSEIGWRHLAATASIPLCFPPVEIHGRRYVDGGFRGGSRCGRPRPWAPIASSRSTCSLRAHFGRCAPFCLRAVPDRRFRSRS